MKLPKNCTRLDDNRIRVNHSVPNVIFANHDVPIDDSAVKELASLLELQETADKMYAASPELFSEPPKIERVSLSPDFHKGAGIPIGTTMVTRGMAIPQAIGNDINCGVRLHNTYLQKEQILDNLDALEKALRHVFFGGGRNIPLSQKQRRSILTSGINMLNPEPPHEGIWDNFSTAQNRLDLMRVRGGEFGSTISSVDEVLEAEKEGRTPGVWGLEDYLKPGIMRDSQIGSIGGGNHFVEIQYVSKIFNGTTAYYYSQIGKEKQQDYGSWRKLEVGTVVVMIHSGSVNIGHLAGEFYRTLTRELYPKSLKHPKNKIFPLPSRHPAFRKFWTAMHNAANFAFANRLFLWEMMRQTLLETCNGNWTSQLIYDSPHNLMWEKDDESIVHRKGAAPANPMGYWGFEEARNFVGEPVLVPGSMGSPSYLMEGLGSREALYSAAHGAGRALSRGEALKHDDAALDEFLKHFRVVTPIDPNRRDIKRRKDIVTKWRDALKKEAPYAYKNIYPVVDTLENAGIARRVAELQPLLTLKG
jgi:tRNA-splicing ligase RtcB